MIRSRIEFIENQITLSVILIIGERISNFNGKLSRHSHIDQTIKMWMEQFDPIYIENYFQNLFPRL